MARRKKEKSKKKKASSEAEEKRAKEKAVQVLSLALERKVKRAQEVREHRAEGGGEAGRDGGEGCERSQVTKRSAASKKSAKSTKSTKSTFTSLSRRSSTKVKKKGKASMERADDAFPVGEDKMFDARDDASDHRTTKSEEDFEEAKALLDQVRMLRGAINKLKGQDAEDGGLEEG
ncbi:hypothetical protein ACHAWF_009863, partial [Thalassiosira exigua]